MKDDMLYVMHILECIGDIEVHLGGKNKQEFMQNITVQDAVLRKLQIMCESTKRLDTKTKERFPGVAWTEIAGFRNVLVHDYLGDIRLEVVWDVIQQYLPPLKAVMEQVKSQK